MNSHSHHPSTRLCTTISLRVHAETVLGVQSGGVDHRPGLVVTGHLHLPELRAEIEFFTHGSGGNGIAHAQELRATAVIVPRNFTMAVPVQHLVLPALDRNDVWASTHAPNQDPPWSERYAGRLDDELLTFDQYITVDPTLDITFTCREGRDGGGAEVEFAGELRFDRPSHMRLQFRCSKVSTGPATGFDGHQAVLMRAGACALIPRQILSRMAGFNAWKSVRVVEAGGRVVCANQAVGAARSAS